jgi:hypothetical protein
MSLNPEDFKDKPEKCDECGRWNVFRAYPAWQMRVCEECQFQQRQGLCYHEFDDCAKECRHAVPLDTSCARCVPCTTATPCGTCERCQRR